MSDRNGKPRASEALLGELHEMTAKHLLARIKAGDASPAEVACALKMLKDNNIEVIIRRGSALAAISAEVLEALPFPGEAPARLS